MPTTLESRKNRADLLKGREVRRVTSRLQTRSEGGQLHFNGYGSTTDQWYDMGWYEEQIKRGSFTKTLSENPDMQLLINHDGLPLARTTNGSLFVAEDNIGLSWGADCADDDADAIRIARKIDSGLIDQCSFAFRVLRQEWDEDYTKRTILEVNLDRGDVSIVNYGANPNTTVGVAARSLFADMVDMDDDELAELRADPIVIAVMRRLGAAAPEIPAPVHDLALFTARAHASRLRQHQ